ncbi:hypothetical protein ACFE04_021611 [Oxalis oulophora]
MTKEDVVAQVMSGLGATQGRCRRIDDVGTSLGKIGVDPEIDVGRRKKTGSGMPIPRDADLDVELIDVVDVEADEAGTNRTGTNRAEIKDVETRNIKLGGIRSHAVNVELELADG